MRSYGVFAGNQFGQGTGTIWLDNVYCRGYEYALRSCRHAGWGRHNCGHSEDTSIACPDSYNIIGMSMILHGYQSLHGSALQNYCCKGDLLCQWNTPILDPGDRKPLSRSISNLIRVIKSGTTPHMQTISNGFVFF